MPGKRYYWLKLQHDFFQSKRIKKLRKLAGGDTYTIIYLKMQLKAILNDGVLTYAGIEPTFAEEVALDIDEEPDNVLVTINYLLSCGLMETSDNREYALPYAMENTGAADSSAERVRRFRERQKQLALEGKSDGTPCNVTSVTNCNGEKEKDKEVDTDTEKNKEGEPERKPFGRFVRLTDKEFASLLRDFGTSEFYRRKEAADKEENVGKDFVQLIREA